MVTSATGVFSGTSNPSPSATGTSKCGNGGLTVISRQSDLDALSGCSTYDGTLLFSHDFSGNADIPDSIETVTGGIEGNPTSATSISAQGLQQLGTTGSSNQFLDSLSILNSPLITNANFPALTSCGGNLYFANNSALNNINGFPLLQTVGGNVDLTGDLNSVSLPSLNAVGGGVNIQSSSSSFLCPIPNDRTNGVIHGKGFVCSGNIQHPTPGVSGANYTANTFPPQSVSTAALGFLQSGILYRNDCWLMV
jgi:hypothetical protein